MKVKCFGFLGAVLLVTGVTSCATITRGSNDVLVINSDPSGAKVTTSTGLTGTTPATFKVNRRGGFVVKIQKDGYETAEVQISSKIHGAGGTALAGNVLIGGLIGAVVDASTGAAYDLVPNPVNLKLVPLSTSPAVPTPTRVAVVAAPPSGGPPPGSATEEERLRAAEVLRQITVNDVRTRVSGDLVTADISVVNGNGFAVSNVEIECVQDGVALRATAKDAPSRGVDGHATAKFTDVNFGRARSDKPLSDCRVWRVTMPSSALSMK